MKSDEIVQFDHGFSWGVPDKCHDVVVYDVNDKAEISLRKVYEDVEKLKKEIEVLKRESP